jgi:hypothetical protein
VALIDAVATAVRELARNGHASCLVGGLAVSSRCDPRFTRDGDLAVVVTDDAEAERAVAGLVTLGYRVGMITEQEAADRLAMTRVTDPSGAHIDLLFASSGIEAEVVAAAEPLEIVPGVRLPTATVGHLIALKLLSVAPGRETDAMDLRNLAAIATDADWAVAIEAVSRITARGFHRDRNLGAALAELRETSD